MTLVLYPKKRVGPFSFFCGYAEWFSVPRYVGGISHGYLILEEEGPNGTLFQKDGVLPHFHIAVYCRLV